MLKVLNAFFRGRTPCGCPGRGCPALCRLLTQLEPHVAVSEVGYSMVGAGTHLRPHCGPHNRRLKFHLGLQVPQPVAMRIGTEIRTWTVGKVNLLDDSFEHEVWNNSTEARVVLEVIFDHPGLANKGHQ